MIAVIFDDFPRDNQRDAYLAAAAALRQHLEQMDGFLGIERYESLTQPGKLLSLSFWRDDDAVANWRTFEAHRAAQSAGRAYIFADYRVRVAQVTRDYGLNDRDDAPADSVYTHRRPPP